MRNASPRAVTREPTKVPKQPTGINAKSTLPATWTTFENVLAAAERFDGIGFVFSADDPFTGVDFDKIIDTETGEVHPVAEEMVTELDSFTERSPSGVGLHAMIVASKNGFSRCNTDKTPWGAKFEVYDKERFFTVTGKRWNDRGVESRQKQLDQLLKRIWPNENGKPKPKPSKPKGSTAPKPDPKVLERWQERDWFERLQEKTDADQSAVDFAIACAAVEDGADFDEVCRLVSAARGARVEDDKAVRSDYLVRTANRALAKTSAKDDAQKLTKLLGLDKVGKKVIGAATYGPGSRARVDLALSDAGVIVFEKAADMASPTKLAGELAMSVGATPSLKRDSGIQAMALVHRLALAEGGAILDADARDWGRTFMELAKVEPVDMDDPADRWRAFCTLNVPGSPGQVRYGDAPPQPVMLEDAHGWRYVCVGEFWEHCRSYHIGPAALKTQMLGVGWRRRGERGNIKARQPNGKGQIVRALYLVPPGWEWAWSR